MSNQKQGESSKNPKIYPNKASHSGSNAGPGSSNPPGQGSADIAQHTMSSPSSNATLNPSGSQSSSPKTYPKKVSNSGSNAGPSSSTPPGQRSADTAQHKMVSASINVTLHPNDIWSPSTKTYPKKALNSGSNAGPSSSNPPGQKSGETAQHKMTASSNATLDPTDSQSSIKSANKSQNSSRESVNSSTQETFHHENGDPIVPRMPSNDSVSGSRQGASQPHDTYQVENECEGLSPEDFLRLGGTEREDLDAAGSRLATLGQQLLNEMNVVEGVLTSFGSLLLTEIEIITGRSQDNHQSVKNGGPCASIGPGGSGRDEVTRLSLTAHDASTNTGTISPIPSEHEVALPQNLHTRVIHEGSKTHPKIVLATNPDLRERLDGLEAMLHEMKKEMAERDKRAVEVYSSLNQAIGEVKKETTRVHEHIGKINEQETKQQCTVEAKLNLLQEQIRKLAQVVWEVKCETKAQMHFGRMPK